MYLHWLRTDYLINGCDISHLPLQLETSPNTLFYGSRSIRQNNYNERLLESRGTTVEKMRSRQYYLGGLNSRYTNNPFVVTEPILCRIKHTNHRLWRHLIGCVLPLHIMDTERQKDSFVLLQYYIYDLGDQLREPHQNHLGSMFYTVENLGYKELRKMPHACWYIPKNMVEILSPEEMVQYKLKNKLKEEEGANLS